MQHIDFYGVDPKETKIESVTHWLRNAITGLRGYSYLSTNNHLVVYYDENIISGNDAYRIVRNVLKNFTKNGHLRYPVI